MPVVRQVVDQKCFNPEVSLPYELRVHDFTSAMQDVYDFFFDVNSHLTNKGLGRLEDTLRKANLSGTLSDMVTASLAKHSRVLTQNRYHNGHPDLIVKGIFANDSVKAGDEGVEIKTTVKKGGAVDTHGARDQWLCVFVYEADNETEPAIDRQPLRFTEVYLSHVQIDDFRRNDRGELGTRTATLHKEGIQKLRRSWVYLDMGSVDDTESGQGS
ncbi:MAG: hypothetical protein F4129_01250 [Acidimicrobiia bacterium]|nr:hypothetical protein [Acidimicrobiia bacterium]MYG73057.1 hypothetical protein [Acidimicrobiia bacterium]MYH95110.1 hypothetical protein [Acidimicrobiia bacterium]